MGCGPVRDRRDRGATGAQVARGQLAHLAGADEQHGAAVEIAEDLLCERGGGGRHRRRALADRGLDARATARVQRLAEEAVEQRAGRTDLEGIAHLAEDLALAGHERVETGGDAEQVEGGAVVAEPVEHRRERGPSSPGELEQRGARALVEIERSSSLAR